LKLLALIRWRSPLPTAVFVIPTSTCVTTTGAFPPSQWCPGTRSVTLLSKALEEICFVRLNSGEHRAHNSVFGFNRKSDQGGNTGKLHFDGGLSLGFMEVCCRVSEWFARSGATCSSSRQPSPLSHFDFQILPPDLTMRRVDRGAGGGPSWGNVDPGQLPQLRR
jgi:hypothetical protein